MGNKTAFRRIRYGSVSPWVDLDVITTGKGIVLALLITEKQPQAD